jgi:Flp pilus assembly pilin Flp
VQLSLSHSAALGAGAIKSKRPRFARLVALCRDRRAVVAMEYAVIAGVMVFVVFTVSGPFGTALGNMFDTLANNL